MSYALTVDDSGRASFLPPEILLPPTTDEVIAPWLIPEDDEPPTPPPKPRGFGFPQKASFSSFGIPRQSSVTSLLPIRQSRPSESLSIHSLADSTTSSSQGDSSSSYRHLEHSYELPKSKSSISMISNLLKKSRSKSRLRADSDVRRVSPSVVPVDTRVAFLPLSGPPSPTSKRRGKKKPTQEALPPLPSKQPEFTLDTNLDHMEGIVDLTVLPTHYNQDGSSPSSGVDSTVSQSDHSIRRPSSPSSMFHNPNPFLPSAFTMAQRSYFQDIRKVSPKTQILPPSVLQLPVLDPNDPNVWTAPDSWAVEKEGEDMDEPEYSSSDDSGLGRPSLDPAAAKRKSRRKTMKRPKAAAENKLYKIRIYRASNAYHIILIGLEVTVSDLTPRLNEKLLLGKERESHKLYLKERGRERMLAATEHPADIVRKRLEQVGYDTADGLDVMGEEDLTFLLKFVYKSQLLGPADEELMFHDFDNIDLTGRSLRTIPVLLHAHAEDIYALTLSSNPMLDIPLDFLQSCTNLRELRLSNMSMKKVPQNVRHGSTLRELDISCNRIIDLNDAGLDRIPQLTTLQIQNNRMEKLPWYFPRLRALQSLNISNNKFRDLPAVLNEISCLVELDMSFNMISELPEEIGQLKCLEKLIIVGNQVTRFPDQFIKLGSLRLLDCRRNNILDLTVASMLPKLETLRADHNAVHALDLALGPSVMTLDASHNQITQLSLTLGPVGRSPYCLVSLDISYAKLSSLDDLALAQLSSLQTLKIDHNSFRRIPDSLGELSRLVYLSCSDNQLDALPESIGRLQKLETLDAHNNSLIELPPSLWNCASLIHINVTSNLIGAWHDPPSVVSPSPSPPAAISPELSKNLNTYERKTSGVLLGPSRPPLAYSLERLYLGENRLTDDGLLPLAILRELRFLNLSFNEIQNLPPTFFKHLTQLEELYLSGNKLSSIPTEDLPRLTRLSVLFLNGNRLQTLPQELGKVQSLTALDVGSNILRYNINNWEFDWNWNFNKNLRYLNLSGNKRLQIKSDANTKTQPGRGRYSHDTTSRKCLSGFTDLTQLRVLGLMDVTITTTGMNTNIDIPDENENRRVRTSMSTVNGMAYGIADSLGQNEHLNMLDLVHEFRGKRAGEALFAMFGRAQPIANGNNRLSKYLHDGFLRVFSSQLDALRQDQNETIPDALRRTFLKLNKELHDSLHNNPSRKMSQASAPTTGAIGFDPSILRSGASGIVIYFKGKTMYVANAGNALAVISRQGNAEALSRKHDPFDHAETTRIRSAEGWVSPEGYVNGEVDISRSFGFYHLLPIVNARPDICTLELTTEDEFVIIGNRGLWDYVSYQTAVDIARSERNDPMIAAQKLRDFAISYGAEGSTMIMVIGVADLFQAAKSRSRQPTVDLTDGSLTKRRRKDEITDRNISRLEIEVEPPQGHLALVFTDIRNSTHLWEANPGMPTAMRLHNNLLRRRLRFCRGYEVKTEGDAFMCSFPTTLSAVWWCLTVQIQLLHESWPLEILECQDGKPIYDSQDRLVARGLSVRMGIHCGTPLCEKDPITHRMDYFGPMVNRSARIEGSAIGGQIMCSADVIREINARILECEPETEFSDLQPLTAVEAIRRMGVVIVPVGEVKLKGLEVPETLSAIYPSELEGRRDLKQVEPDVNASRSRVQFSVVQMRELGVLCLRLEALASSRIFRVQSDHKTSPENVDEEERSEFMYMDGDPLTLLPTMNEKSSDAYLMMLLDSLSVRIQNALESLCQLHQKASTADLMLNSLQHSGLDKETLQVIMNVLRNT